MASLRSVARVRPARPGDPPSPLPAGLVAGDEHLGREGGDGLADGIEREVVERAEAEARLAQVELLARRGEGGAQARLAVLVAVDAREVEGVVVLLRGEGDVGERLFVVGVRVARERDLIADHPPVHRLLVPLGQVLPHDGPHHRDHVTPVRREFIKVAVNGE
jgi:hypothetical protein